MEVYALVGSTGTGKSHRAAFVAHEYKIDVIIDDGLVIKGATILGGISAKSQPSALGAVRTALFTNPGHAANAIELVGRSDSQKVLILGTSLEMVKKIANRLDLPEPQHIINISEIATEKEIETARYMRKIHGKHVIPAPKTEVRKSFSGVLIDPINVFLRLKNKPRPQKSIEKTVVRPAYFLLGKISVSDGTINSLIKRIIQDSGLPARVGKVHINQTQEGVLVNVTAQVKHGTFIPEVLMDMQRLLTEKIEYLTGLNIISIDITANKIEFDLGN